MPTVVVVVGPLVESARATAIAFGLADLEVVHLDASLFGRTRKEIETLSVGILPRVIEGLTRN